MPLTMRSPYEYQMGSWRRRRGFSLVEVVVIMTIMAVIAALLMPTLRKTFTANTRHEARRDALSYLYRAQATAVQYSRRSWLIRSGNTLKVVVDSSGTYVQRGLIDLNATYGATLTATPNDTVQFDPRGFAILNGTTPRYIVTVGSSADTVCISGMSKIATKGC